MNYRLLSADRIIETQRKLQERITRRFPSSGLSEVAEELSRVASEATQRAESIRRPHVPIRIGVVALLLGALGLVVAVIFSSPLRTKADLGEMMNLVQFADAAISTCVFLGVAILFLVSLEIRYRRARALAALHELRAIAHVVDMHQIAKDPEGLLRRGNLLTASGEQTTKTLFDLNRYLNYCNELLAILSKIAALYVQQFPDAAVVSAVDQVESLCSGLSHRIWQKIMVLDQTMDEELSGSSNDNPQESTA